MPRIRGTSPSGIGAGWVAPSATWGGPSGSSSATVQLGLNEMRAYPWDVAGKATISQLALGVTTGQAGGLARLSLWADDGTGAYPGALIADFLTVSQASIADVATASLATPVVVQNQRVWLATRQEGTGTVPTIRVANPTGNQPWNATLNASTLQGVVKVTGSTGSLPGTFPAGGTLTAAGPPLRALTA